MARPPSEGKLSAKQRQDARRLDRLISLLLRIAICQQSNPRPSPRGLDVDIDMRLDDVKTMMHVLVTLKQELEGIQGFMYKRIGNPDRKPHMVTFTVCFAYGAQLVTDYPK
jgi:hypothetical protein